LGAMPLQEYVEEIEVPDGVVVEIEGSSRIRVKGKLGQVVKDLSHANVRLEVASNKILVKLVGRGRRAKALMGTIRSIIENMIVGVTQGFTYKMKIVASHFPITVKVQGDTVYIENFIGERAPRIAKIVGEGTRVEVKGDGLECAGLNHHVDLPIRGPRYEAAIPQLLQPSPLSSHPNHPLLLPREPTVFSALLAPGPPALLTLPSSYPRPAYTLLLLLPDNTILYQPPNILPSYCLRDLLKLLGIELDSMDPAFQEVCRQPSLECELKTQPPPPPVRTPLPQA